MNKDTKGNLPIHAKTVILFKKTLTVRGTSSQRLQSKNSMN